MRNRATVIYQVLDPDTKEVLAFEIVCADGGRFFAANDPFWEGMRVGSFPDYVRDGRVQRFERVELARLLVSAHGSSPEHIKEGE